MFERLIIALGKLDSRKHERVAMFFMILGKIEARLMGNSPRLYFMLEALIGTLDDFAESLTETFTSDARIMCGEIRLYVVCPWLWQEFRDRGLRKGYRYINLEETVTVNEYPC